MSKILCLTLAALACFALLQGCPSQEAKTDPKADPEGYIEEVVQIGCGRKGVKNVVAVQEQNNIWRVTLQQKVTAGKFDLIKWQVIECYGAIFNSALHVSSATIEAATDLVDGLGNEFESVVYTTTMRHRIASRINWENAAIVDLADVADETFIHRVLRE